jgi:E3 ubiquitin-protein ligase TRAF7
VSLTDVGAHLALEKSASERTVRMSVAKSDKSQRHTKHVLPVAESDTSLLQLRSSASSSARDDDQTVYISDREKNSWLYEVLEAEGGDVALIEIEGNGKTLRETRLSVDLREPASDSKKSDVVVGDDDLDDSVPRLYEGDVSESLRCALHDGVLMAPVIVGCGHTFCRRCVALARGRSCPIDGVALSLDMVIPNLAVAAQLGDLLVRCRHGCRRADDGAWVRDDDGCASLVSVGRRDEHESTCDFAPIECSHCGSANLRRMQLDVHIERCDRVRCPHERFGCQFQGTKLQLDAHLTDCIYQRLSHYLHTQEERINELERRNRHLVSSSSSSSAVAASSSSSSSPSPRAGSLDSVANRQERMERAIRFLSNSLESTRNDLALALDQLAELRAQFLQQRGDSATAATAPTAAMPASSSSSASQQQQHEQQLQQRQVGQPHTEDRIVEKEALAVGAGAYDVKCVHTLAGHQGPVWSLAVSADGGVLASGSSDSTVRVWNVHPSVGKCVLFHEFHGHTGIVHAVAVSLGAADRIFSGASDKLIKVWSLRSRRLVKTIEDTNTVCRLVLQGRMLMSGSYMTIRLYSIDNYTCLHTLTGSNHWVRAMCLSRNGILYSGAHNMIKVWQINQRLPSATNCTNTIRGDFSSIYCLEISQDKLFVATYENVIHVLDRNDFRVVAQLVGHAGAVYSLAISNGRLFSGSYDNTIRVWSLSTLRCILTLRAHTSSVDSIVANSNRVYSCSADHAIRVWA